VNPPVPLTQSVQDAETRVDLALAQPESIRHALTWGCGLLEGYYRAGAVSKVEYEAGCAYVRRAANQRLSIHKLQEDAVAEGLADD
jgi:hypothetical protein